MKCLFHGEPIRHESQRLFFMSCWKDGTTQFVACGLQLPYHNEERPWSIRSQWIKHYHQRKLWDIRRWLYLFWLLSRSYLLWDEQIPLVNRQTAHEALWWHYETRHQAWFGFIDLIILVYKANGISDYKAVWDLSTKIVVKWFIMTNSGTTMMLKMACFIPCDIRHSAETLNKSPIPRYWWYVIEQKARAECDSGLCWS